MSIYCNHLFHEIFFLGGHADDTLAASLLCGIGIAVLSLDIARMAHSDHTGMTVDEVFQNDLIFHGHNLGSASIAVLALDLQHIVLDNAVNSCGIA